MIRIVLGNVGSGKSAMVVREMLLSSNIIYSNIITEGVEKNIVIEKANIIKEEVVSIKRNGEEVKKYTLNKEFWQDIAKKGETISIILDEAHTLLNSRVRNKTTLIMTDFMALLRRILGSSNEGYGELILISQLERRLDVIAREMATVVQYCICHYKRNCSTCGDVAIENNETPSKLLLCPYCGNGTTRTGFEIEVFNFESMDVYNRWEYARKNNHKIKNYFKHYVIKDIENVFPHYNTLQWENLLSD